MARMLSGAALQLIWDRGFPVHGSTQAIFAGLESVGFVRETQDIWRVLSSAGGARPLRAFYDFSHERGCKIHCPKVLIGKRRGAIFSYDSASEKPQTAI